MSSDDRQGTGSAMNSPYAQMQCNPMPDQFAPYGIQPSSPAAEIDAWRRQRALEQQAQASLAYAAQSAPRFADPIRREALSFAINAKLTGPAEIVRAAREFEAYLRGEDHAPSPDAIAVARAMGR